MSYDTPEQAIEALQDQEWDDREQFNLGSRFDPTGNWERMLRSPELRLTEKFVSSYGVLAFVNPSRHPCGEFWAPWESADQYYERQYREGLSKARLERELCEPETHILADVLTSRVSIDTKKEAVTRWMAKLGSLASPVLLPHIPRGEHFFGFAWYDLQCANELQECSEWEDYQAELKAAKAERNAPREAAMSWLRRNASKVLKSRPDPAVKAESASRLEVVGWTIAEYRSHAATKGWIK